MKYANISLNMFEMFDVLRTHEGPQCFQRYPNLKIKMLCDYLGISDKEGYDKAGPPKQEMWKAIKKWTPPQLPSWLRGSTEQRREIKCIQKPENDFLYIVTDGTSTDGTSTDRVTSDNEATRRLFQAKVDALKKVISKDDIETAKKATNEADKVVEQTKAAGLNVEIQVAIASTVASATHALSLASDAESRNRSIAVAVGHIRPLSQSMDTEVEDAAAAATVAKTRTRSRTE